MGTQVSRVLRHRPYLCFVIVPLTIAALLILLYHLVLIIYTYREYVLALLPDSPLPLQHYPSQTHNRESVGEGSDRILCLISTSPKYHETRAQHVAATWAPHCKRAVFLTTQKDPLLPDILITPGANTYNQLWNKVTQGFEWAYDHRDEFDWVVKADDDTFLLVENLQAAVRGLDPLQPQATGVHLRTWDRGSTYLNGGAGYVLSRGAVIKLVESGLQKHQCDHNLSLGTGEDVNMADCLAYLGVELLDSRDSSGRQRFNIYPPQELVDPRQAQNLRHLWLKQISIFPYKFGYAELSDEVISFHYVDSQTMYLLYYLVYLLNPQGNLRSYSPSPLLPTPQPASLSKSPPVYP
ncbi:hypothetical protein Pcinc_004134 [Petrolisthes cinctipes]|uniref:N-acetylgalactosaminide beta-1,3-galactosyltransferase n=1 Tax=Petrolisthes cinctipes TaxID=88211 RepID=A0AAE1GHX0_PETCI|nr:hypothetical protein Pcinc_004134 [Petrolisthes cinctipes]